MRQMALECVYIFKLFPDPPTRNGSSAHSDIQPLRNWGAPDFQIWFYGPV